MIKLFYQNVVNTCWEEMEPGDVQIDYSSNVDEAFQVEKESRRESRAIEIQVTRMNFRHRMKSRNVFHCWHIAYATWGIRVVGNGS